MSAAALVVGGREISYRRLEARVAAVARRMASSTPGAEAPARPAGAPTVAAVADRDLRSVVLVLALERRGEPYALLHPRWTAREREAACARFGLSQIGSAGTVESRGEHTGQGLERPATFEVGSGHRVLFSSGSTGEPKAVVASRRAFASAATASEAVLGWRADDRWLLTMPLAHVGGLAILDRCLRARRAIVLQDGHRFEADQLVRQIRRDRVTLLSLVPTMLHRLVENGYRAPRSVRAVLLGGASVSPALVERGRDLGWPLLCTYGLTEACSQVATERPGSAARGRLAGSCGQPLPGVEVRIAGSRRGEIEIRGESLFSGYLVDTDDGLALDRSGFTADGWFCTGDLGCFEADGVLRPLGRASETIISGGENVSPAEVEAVLESHPGVRRACVFGVADEEWGESVAAAIVVAPHRCDEADLVAWLEQRLAPFKLPRKVARLAELPLGANGKLDRAACRHAAAAQLRPLRPESRARRSGSALVPPGRR